ncbi:MAG: adenylate/guanylate cyclase domain-containing protein, partial [Leptospiraceae bacterium]|nr:adenylate/guanylate cyclase domain-containing protein [Leptospiraceae bacterium]
IISPVGFHFLNSQFPGKLLRRVTISNYLISGIVSLSLFLPTNYFTEVILKYQFIFFIYLIFGFSFLFYFTLKGFQGAKLLTSGLLVVLIFAINDILYSNLIINSLFLAHYGIAFLIFTQSLGISIRFSKAFASIENLTKNLKEVNQSYRRFVPKEFLRFLNKSEITEISLGEQVQSEMTILFSDIRSFTELSEKMSPGDNFNFLNSYLSRMGPIVRGHDGFIDKYIGDGIMALFPGEVEDAINSAIAMQKEIRVYNKHRMKSNYDGIKVGIGVHTGTLILGTIGEEQRMESTVISDAVNLASRIEGLTKTYGAYILISEHSFNLIKDKNIYKYRLLDKVKVKGKSNYTLVYEIFDGMPEYLLEIYLKTKNNIEKGLHLYWKENYRDAIHYFNRVKSELPLDLANNRFLELSKMEINK